MGIDVVVTGLFVTAYNQGAFPLLDINDSQTPGWASISDGQTPGWSDIDDSQASGWTDTLDS